MPRPWRDVLKFAGDDDVDFPMVHDRFRDLMMSTVASDADRLLELADAFESARKELATHREQQTAILKKAADGG